MPNITTSLTMPTQPRPANTLPTPLPRPPATDEPAGGTAAAVPSDRTSSQSNRPRTITYTAGDDALIAAVKQGDVHAWQHYVHSSVGEVRLKLQRQFHLTVKNGRLNNDDLEDSLQEAFAQAFEKIGDWRGNEIRSFSNWVYVIAKNDALHRLKTNAGSRKVALDESKEIIDDNWDGRDLTRSLAQEVKSRSVIEAMKVLSSGEAQVIKLKFLRDPPLQNPEIARVLNIGPQSVAVVSSRAIKKLKKYMQGSRAQL